MLSLKKLNKKEKILFKYIYQNHLVNIHVLYDNFILDYDIIQYSQDDMEVQLNIEINVINMQLRNIQKNSLITLFNKDNNLYIELTSDVKNVKRTNIIKKIIK